MTLMHYMYIAKLCRYERCDVQDKVSQTHLIERRNLVIDGVQTGASYVYCVLFSFFCHFKTMKKHLCNHDKTSFLSKM